MFKSLICLFALLTAALAVPAPLEDEPFERRQVAAPAGFNITSLGVVGTGCPPGTTYYALSADRTAVTVTFSEFYAEAGPGISASKNRKACQLTLGVKIPSGFSFAVASVDYRGYYQLDSGVTATQQSKYYFQGRIVESTALSNLKGPINGKSYTYRDQFALASTNLSPCGTSTVLNINSELRVSNSGNSKGTGYIATDSIDTSLSTVFNLSWGTCRN